MGNAALMRLERVSKLYTMGRGTVRALRAIDLEVGEGEFLAVTGPSGSGKSTLLHLMGGLDTPTEGRIWWQVRDLTRLEGGALAAWRGDHVGFVFQAYNLVPTLTAQENVALPLLFRGISPSEREQRAVRLLERVGLERRRAHRPSELSGGEQQRVALARALAGDPDLILADEPTGNLDAESGSALLGLLRELNAEGASIVLATHDPEAAHYAARFARLVDGLLGPAEE